MLIYPFGYKDNKITPNYTIKGIKYFVLYPIIPFRLSFRDWAVPCYKPNALEYFTIPLGIRVLSLNLDTIQPWVKLMLVPDSKLLSEFCPSLLIQNAVSAWLTAF